MWRNADVRAIMLILLLREDFEWMGKQNVQEFQF